MYSPFVTPCISYLKPFVHPFAQYCPLSAWTGEVCNSAPSNHSTLILLLKNQPKKVILRSQALLTMVTIVRWTVCAHIVTIMLYWNGECTISYFSTFIKAAHILHHYPYIWVQGYILSYQIPWCLPLTAHRNISSLLLELFHFLD